LIRKECAERYHKLEYVAKQLAHSHQRSSKDISLLCSKLKELSIEDWECRAYGFPRNPEEVEDQLWADTLPDVTENLEASEDIQSAIGDGAEWDMLTDCEDDENSINISITPIC
jgi:hypothetical protein